MNIVIVGGHGNVSIIHTWVCKLIQAMVQVSMRLARLLAGRASISVTSIFRNAAHSDEVAATGSTPLVLSLEDEPKETFATVFEGKDVVYFSAGAGGKGGPERTRKVDYEGALKIFDAVELVKGTKPRLIMVSAIDIRDRSAPVPSHYVSIITATISSLSLTGAIIADRSRYKALRARLELHRNLYASQV